jgi:hypothetical protein
MTARPSTTQATTTTCCEGSAMRSWKRVRGTSRCAIDSGKNHSITAAIQ